MIGAALVYFSKKELKVSTKKIFVGFAAGVMVAASVWSLLLPALDRSEYLGKLSFLPAVIGFILGILSLLFLDKLVDKLINKNFNKKIISTSKNNAMLLLAVTIHNIPEGMAVGVVFASCLAGNFSLLIMGAFTLAIGIAIQNIPEGAIISLPLVSEGFSKNRAFVYGMLSGIVEPLFAFLTILLINFVVPILPYLLAYAAGAMFYVVIEELIPELHEGKKSYIGVVSFMFGFVVMMILDVLLG